MNDIKYEVVCTSSYLDVGLMIEEDDKLNPKRVLARSFTYGTSEYGGVGTSCWIKTGIFLTTVEWKNISYNKSTDQILKELGIDKSDPKRPFKIGDKVYILGKFAMDEYADTIMIEAEISHIKNRQFVSYSSGNNYGTWVFSRKHLNKSVFKDRSMAMQELVRRKQQHI